ncbi:MAG: ACT domain-containing protein [Desulfomonilia bacterium]|jgi:phosphoserine phosphatase
MRSSTMNSMLYIVYGIGTDSVGLVGAITSPIAQVKGNIVDLRQDVLHGLFTIYLVVDLSKATVSVKEFRGLVDKIASDTGLKLSIEKYTPVPRGLEKKNMLVTLVGKDKAGIIAAITEKLGTYNINIEVSEVVARENIFLMDLMCDVSHSALPTENLKAAIRDTMLSIQISSMFQAEDVFNKKKKIIMFDIAHSFMDSTTMREVMKQALIKPEALMRSRSDETDLAYMHATASLLEGLPLSVIDTVMNATDTSQGTQELLQTLKIMGYKIGLISGGFSFFTNALKKRLGIDYVYAFELPIDDDSQAVIGDLPAGLMQPVERAKIIAGIMKAERIDEEDITIISDKDIDYPSTPGIRLIFNMKVMLDLVNQHALSKDSLTGLLRGFGIPRPL